MDAAALAALEDDLADTAYRPMTLIGQGGMGSVVEVVHRTLGTRFVVKFVHADARPDLEDRLRMEAQTLARLTHPRILAVLDLARSRSGKLFMVTEKLEGHTLKTELSKRGRLPTKEAVEIACQALDGLGAAHALGLVHRDVKADNLFLVRSEAIHLKVIDFGIVKIVDAEGKVATVVRDIAPLVMPTSDGMIVGTPSTIAPEHILGKRVDHRADLYAMGHVLFRALTGRFAFNAGSLMELMNAHVHDTPPTPSSLAPELSTDLDAVVLRALAKSPDDRFVDARGMAEALRASNLGTSRGTFDDEPTMMEDELTHQDDSTLADDRS